jgi:hypothetical protein
MSSFVPQQAGAIQGTAIRRVATFNVSSRREKSLSASISYTTAPPRMFTSKLHLLFSMDKWNTDPAPWCQ